MTTEEREIVEAFERGELRRVADVEAEMEATRQADAAGHGTGFNLVHAREREECIQ